MTSRYLIDIENRKSKIIHVYRNGDKYNRAALVLLRPIEQQKLERIFRAIEEKLTLPYNKPIRKIYTLKGREIEDPILVKDQKYYVVGSSENFVNTKYGSIYKWTIIGPVKWSKFSDVFYEPPEQNEFTMNQKSIYSWRTNTVNSARLPPKMTKSMSAYTTDRKLMRNSKMMTLSMEQSKRPVSEPSNDVKTVKKRNAGDEYFSSRSSKNRSGDGSISSPKLSSVENRRSMDQFLNDSLKMYNLKDNISDDIKIQNEISDQNDEEYRNTVYKDEVEIKNNENEYLKDISENYLENNVETNEIQIKEDLENIDLTENEIEMKSDSEIVDKINNIQQKYENDQLYVQEAKNIINGNIESDNGKKQQTDDLYIPSSLGFDSKESSFIINETDDLEEDNLDVKEFEENERKVQIKEMDENNENEVFSEIRDTSDYAKEEDNNENLIKEDKLFSNNDESRNISEEDEIEESTENNEFLIKSDNSGLIKNYEEKKNADEIEMQNKIIDDEEETETDQDKNSEINQEEENKRDTNVFVKNDVNSENTFNENENIDPVDTNNEEEPDDENQDDIKLNKLSLTKDENDRGINKEFEKNDLVDSVVNDDYNVSNVVQENEDLLTNINQIVDSSFEDENVKENLTQSVHADQYNIRLETSNINSYSEIKNLDDFENSGRISLDLYNKTLDKKILGAVETKELKNDSSADESDYDDDDDEININKNDHKFKERDSYHDNSLDTYSNKNESDFEENHEIMYNTNNFSIDQENLGVIDNDQLPISEPQKRNNIEIIKEVKHNIEEKDITDEECDQSLEDETVEQSRNTKEDEKYIVYKNISNDEESQSSNENEEELKISFEKEEIQKYEDKRVKNEIEDIEEIESENDSEKIIEICSDKQSTEIQILESADEENEDTENSENNIVVCSEKELTEIQILESKKNEDEDTENSESNVVSNSEQEQIKKIFQSKDEEDASSPNSEKEFASYLKKDLNKNHNVEIKINENVSNDGSNIESENELDKSTGNNNPTVEDHREQYNRIEIKTESPNSFISDERKEEEIYLDRDDLSDSKINIVDKENAAKIIQKNFRGHLVRKELTHNSEDIDNDNNDSEGNGHRSYDEKESDEDENDNDMNLSWLKESTNAAITNDEDSKLENNFPDDIFSMNMK